MKKPTRHIVRNNLLALLALLATILILGLAAKLID